MTAPRVAALVLLVWGCRNPAPPAALVLRGGVVYTMTGLGGRAEAVAVAGGKIVYVGSDSGVRPRIGRRTEVIDLGGRAVLPGFHDSHVHPVKGGLELGALDLSGARTRADVAEAVGRYAAEHPDVAWVRGRGWALPIFPGANPHRAFLDSLVPDRPAYLKAQDGHSAWVNSRALAAAGITAATREPPHGRIERDQRGEPTGTLRERAMDLVERMLPARDSAEHVAALRRALAMAAGYGITALHDAHADSARLEAYAALEARGELTTWATASMPVDLDEPIDRVIARLDRWRARYAGRLVRPVGAKIYVDGVIEAHTAALLQPYLDRPGDRGPTIAQPARLEALVRELDAAGFAVHFHAIGDRAARMALGAVEQAHGGSAAAGRRHLLAHLELIDPDDLPRFASLGVVAVFQPLWAYADAYITDLTEPRLGPERSGRLYPIASVARAGAVVAAGSDWPVSSMDPWRAIEVGITRRRPGAGQGAAWIPGEVADLATMLAAYTVQGAYASGLEAVTGSLEVGKAADLVVLDRDPAIGPPHGLHEIRVLLTLFRGRVTYRDPGLEKASAAGQLSRVVGAVAKW